MRFVAIALSMLLMALPAAAETPATSAKAFLDGIYDPWMTRAKAPDGPAYRQPSYDRTYAPELAALLNKDKAIARRTGDAGVVDWVVLCGCQDDGGMIAKVSVPAATENEATAKVALSFDGKYAKTLTLKLVKLARGWRIADISDRDTPSVLALLRKALGGNR